MKKLIFLVLVIAVAAPLILKGPDGEPIMKLADWLPDKEASTQLSDPGPDQSYYRYRDASGNWQYTDSPPAGIAYETVAVNTNTNLIQATPLPDKKEKTVMAEAEPKGGVAGYVDNLQDAMQDAENVQQLMDDRTGQLEQQFKSAQ